MKLTNEVIGIEHRATQRLVIIRHLEGDVQLQSIRYHGFGHSEIVTFYRNIVIGKLVRRSVQGIRDGGGGGRQGEIGGRHEARA